ncbi:unnamed protein product [Schistocephalus solidus]|uniref:Secreted protein n=1 Tax=Schistocephalus solidus TaxID=70667 RepID=A0A183TSZ5_SCHSO|nr:unnamed protein product [Schistocephalus solidus]
MNENILTVGQWQINLELYTINMPGWQRSFNVVAMKAQLCLLLLTAIVLGVSIETQAQPFMMPMGAMGPLPPMGPMGPIGVPGPLMSAAWDDEQYY